MAGILVGGGQYGTAGSAREGQPRLVAKTTSPVAIAYCDAETCYRFVNAYYAERYGLVAEQLLGRLIREVVGETTWAACEGYIREGLAGKATEFDLDLNSATDGGEPRFERFRYEPEWRDGKVTGLIATITPITELTRAEEYVRASEMTFRQMVENSPFGIYAVDADFRIVYLSAGAVKGFTNDRLVGLDIGEALRRAWPESFASELVRQFHATLDTGRPYRARATVERRADTGAVEAYDWQMERLVMPDGRFGVVVHFYDLSERQRYESSLRDSEARFRVMFDASSVGKAEVDPETTRFLRVNAAMCEFVGYSEAELVARTAIDITHPDDRKRSFDLGRRLVDGEPRVFDVEKRYVRKDGSVVWGRTTVNVVRDASGRPLHHVAVVQDLTLQKKAERDLEASKDRLQFALNAALLGWWQYDPVDRVVSGDERFRAIFDVTVEATAIAEILKRVLPDDEAAGWAAIESALDPAKSGRSAVQFRLRRRDGEVRWVEVCSLAHFEGSGHERRAVSVVGTAQDVTARKEREAKEQLLLSEVNHRSKNMLSIVNVIARQTAAKTPDDFMERFTERIQALSANQDLLIRNEWERVGIEELVLAQLTHFHDLIGSRINMDGSQLRLNAASAQSLGLALHELATNAGKYGALSTNTGCVDIRWRIEGLDFVMSWSERDGPSVTAPTRRGFGTAIIEAMMAYSVDGKVDLDYPPSGLVWRLRCPSGSILDPRQNKQRSDNEQT